MKENIYLRLMGWVVAVLALSILPLPAAISMYRPPWVLLLVLYVEFYLPGYLRIYVLMLLGLILDVLLASVIGQHSLALLLVTWLASSKSRRFHFFSMAQQTVLVGLFCLMYQIILSMTDGILGLQYSLIAPVISALFSMMFWPWIRILGDSSLLLFVKPPRF